LQLKPDFAEGHLLAGNVLLKVGQQQRAKIEYEGICGWRRKVTMLRKRAD
jgi:hypothetical protein